MCCSKKAGVIVVAVFVCKVIICAQNDPTGAGGEQLPAGKNRSHTAAFFISDKNKWTEIKSTLHTDVPGECGFPRAW